MTMIIWLGAEHKIPAGQCIKSEEFFGEADKFFGGPARFPVVFGENPEFEN